MASKSYTARELLRMRHVPPSRELYDQLYAKLRKDVELSDIVRMLPDRKLPRIKEESPDIPGNSDGRHTLRRAKPRQLDGTESEWKYRGRSDSEHRESQPISAPSSLAAQRDEGFQRFYKAVASPTHVRVTAGGRIVPNTRGASPTGKWSRDKVAGDGASACTPAGRGQQDAQPYPIHQAVYGQFPAMFHPFAPGMAPGIAHAPAPFPVLPLHMGFGMAHGYGMMPPQMGQAPVQKVPVKNLHEPHSQNDAHNDKQGDAGYTENTASSRTIAPDQFDANRPFVYNGQWMVPSGGPFYPYGMPPFHGFPAPQMPGYTLPSQTLPPALVAHNQKSGQSKQDSMPITSLASVASTPNFAQTSSNPPISSIRPSDITKKQIEVLRGSLRYIEDQLQYNRHQIDEKGMENQAQMVRQQIQQFQKNFDEQLAFEEAHYPKGERTDEIGTSASSHAALRSKSSMSSITNRIESLGLEMSAPHIETSFSRTLKSRTNRDRTVIRTGSGINSTKSVPAFATKKPFMHQDSNNVETITKSSGLPFHAALAPPFAPRTETSSPALAGLDHSLNALEAVSGQQGQNKSTGEHLAVERGSYSQASVRSTGTTGKRSAPYLVGHLPSGIHPGSASDTDYTYNRALNDNELRARYMYWGGTPSHLQKGLPKFDGKDFYPPSPIKGSSSESTSSRYYSSDVITSVSAEAEYPLMVPKMEFASFKRVTRNGPGNSTQSESLPRLEGSLGETSSVKVQRAGSCVSRVGRSYDDFRKATLDTTRSSSASSQGKSSSDEGGDEKDLLFKGRRAMSGSGAKARNDIWKSMRKTGKSSGTAIPGSVSSMTAQGVLPQYTGHATASLAPAIANTAASPRGSSNKSGEVEVGSTSPVAEKKGENKHPAEIARTLVGSVRDLKVQEQGQKSFVSHP